MAQKRMFSLSVVDTDRFLEMPISSRLLYYELGMRADDDGFVDNWKKIMLFTGLKEDDLKLLITKQFIIPFESGVIVIKHWRLNNYLQKDRIKPTIYQEELKQLGLDENNAYVLETNDIKNIEIEKTKKIHIEDARQKRIEAKKESDLPYSFEYKIRNAFIGKICPICNREMNATSDKNKPTIQHNKPISLGGKHELDNISVICSNCNCSIQNRIETPPYNTEEVKKIWECIGNVYIDKYSIDKNNIKENTKRKVFKKPTLEEVQEYCKERNNNIDPNNFIDFYESKDWYVGSNKMKDWKACIRTWEKRNHAEEKPEWFNKKIEVINATEQEQNEIKELLKDYE